MKKIVRSLVVTLFLVFALSSVAYAAEKTSDTNVTQDLQMLNMQVQAGDALIYAAIAQAQFIASLPGADQDRIAKDLVKFTESVVKYQDKQAKEVGVELIHEYIPVDVGGVQVMIDPSRVPGV